MQNHERHAVVEEYMSKVENEVRLKVREIWEFEGVNHKITVICALKTMVRNGELNTNHYIKNHKHTKTQHSQIICQHKWTLYKKT